MVEAVLGEDKEQSQELSLVVGGKASPNCPHMHQPEGVARHGCTGLQVNRVTGLAELPSARTSPCSSAVLVELAFPQAWPSPGKCRATIRSL